MNFTLWLTAKRITALNEIEALEEKESYDPEEYALCQELVEFIDLYIDKAKIKTDLLEYEKDRLGKLLIEVQLQHSEEKTEADPPQLSAESITLLENEN